MHDLFLSSGLFSRGVISARHGVVRMGIADLVSFLVAAGEREARQIVTQARRQDIAQYAPMPTSTLVLIRQLAAVQERFRRAVYAIMQWNEHHGRSSSGTLRSPKIHRLIL